MKQALTSMLSMWDCSCICIIIQLLASPIFSSVISFQFHLLSYVHIHPYIYHHYLLEKIERYARPDSKEHINEIFTHYAKTSTLWIIIII